jgi:hypothetical protein
MHLHVQVSNVDTEHRDPGAKRRDRDHSCKLSGNGAADSETVEILFGSGVMHARQTAPDRGILDYMATRKEVFIL